MCVCLSTFYICVNELTFAYVVASLQGLHVYNFVCTCVCVYLCVCMWAYVCVRVCGLCVCVCVCVWSCRLFWNHVCLCASQELLCYCVCYFFCAWLCLSVWTHVCVYMRMDVSLCVYPRLCWPLYLCLSMYVFDMYNCLSISISLFWSDYFSCVICIIKMSKSFSFLSTADYIYIYIYICKFH